MKVVIVGVGGVGSSVAFNVLRLAGAHDVVLVDPTAAKVASHVMDLEGTLTLGATGTVAAGSDDDLGDADVLVVTAAVRQRPGSARDTDLQRNAAILARVVGRLPANWQGVLVVVTNPVDALCTWVHRRSGLERGRVVGYTLNDTLRLRSAAARLVGAPVEAVDAWVIGEHGERAVPLLDHVRVNGRPVSLDAAQKAAAREFVRTWYERHLALDASRSSTWTTGLGLARLVAAIDDAGDDPLPASALLRGEYGVDGVSLSVPVSLGREGVTRIHEWPLTPEERSALAAAADAVRRTADRIEA